MYSFDMSCTHLKLFSRFGILYHEKSGNRAAETIRTRSQCYYNYSLAISDPHFQPDN
jgi:hypothetical protein